MSWSTPLPPRLFSLDPKKRIRASECISHPFLKRLYQDYDSQGHHALFVTPYGARLREEARPGDSNMQEEHALATEALEAGAGRVARAGDGDFGSNLPNRSDCHPARPSGRGGSSGHFQSPLEGPQVFYMCTRAPIPLDPPDGVRPASPSSSCCNPGS